MTGDSVIALAAGLGVFAVCASLLAAFCGRLMTALNRVRPDLRVPGIVSLAAAPFALGLLAAIGAGLFPHASPLELVGHHCHAVDGNCVGHSTPAAPLPLALAVLGLTGALVIRLAWAVMHRLAAMAAFRRTLDRLTLRSDGIRILDTDLALAFVAGLARPAVYLSRGLLSRLAPEERALIKAHEAAHLARGDLRARFAFTVLTAVYPRSASRRLNDAFILAQEQACDHATARHFAPVAIAETLVKVQRANGGRESGLSVAAFDDGQIELRVRALLQPDFEPARLSLARYFTMTGVLLAAIFIALEPIHHEIETLFIAFGG
ncbi:M56 family peptidase [Marinicauda algicola]|uniref:M56 family peptidase n=1 Tax=Marinicauda algicola TaxID=2029849 RepID=A0A4S2GYQ2_9PROT|nr:M56 family metallopeptidase [Marinicauda algicola]TGY88213.1 M56 family peptidase [Marinicauda algicola]